MRKFLLFVFLVFAVCVFTSFADTTFVSGIVSGVWDTTGSPYIVIGNISVPTGDTLTIHEGVKTVFTGYYTLTADSHSVFIANGTETDSIFFTTTDIEEGFAGLFFFACDSVLINYCSFSYGRGNNGVGSEIGGGAISSYSTDIEILHSSFKNCSSVSGGGGAVLVHWCHSLISYCTFSYNEGGCGGAVAASEGRCYLYNNQFIGNESSSVAGALYIYSCEVIVIGNLFDWNESRYWGGAIACSTFAEATFVSNTFSNNRAENGGAIQIGCGSVIFENNYFYENRAYSTGGAIYYTHAHSDLFLINNSFKYNYAETSLVLHISGDMRAIIVNCIIEANLTRETITSECSTFVAFTNVDTSRFDGLGPFIYGEGIIFSTPYLDFDGHIIGSHSPCVDAGAESVYIAAFDTVIFAPTKDIDEQTRPYGLAWDIGDDEYYPDAIDEARSPKPAAFAISAYPNPFNSAVRIVVDSRSESAEPLSTIEIFDVNGRRVERIPPAPLIKGGTEQSVAGGLFIWQPDANIDSGIYLVRAKSGDESISKRIVYLK